MGGKDVVGVVKGVDSRAGSVGMNITKECAITGARPGRACVTVCGFYVQEQAKNNG